jgi:hypothetical protein
LATSPINSQITGHLVETVNDFTDQVIALHAALVADVLVADCCGNLIDTLKAVSVNQPVVGQPTLAYQA